MATYRHMRYSVRKVRVSAGFVPKTCWIAHVLEFPGIRLGAAPNRILPEERKHPCPPAKRSAIVAGLYKLGRVQAAQTDLPRSGL